MIINLTPHDIDVYDDVDVDEDGCVREGAIPRSVCPPSGQVARLEMEDRGLTSVPGVAAPVHRVTYGQLVGLPAPEDTDGDAYVVALPCVVAAVAAGRTDVLVPHRQVRARRPDGTPGAVIGCRAFGTPA